MKLKTTEMFMKLACATLGFSQTASAADPNILVQPTNQVVMAGATASFMVVAAGSTPLNYQWLKDGAALPNSAKASGANSTNLIIRDLAPLDAGAYSVMVTNLNGATNSVAATLRVQTWQNELPENGVASTSSADGVKLVAAAGGGGIYISTNSGAAWLLTSAPFQNWGALACSADGVKIVAAVQYAPAEGWTSIASSADGNKLVASATSGAGFFTWPSVPALDISRAGNGLVVSWPDYALACVLQEKDDLGSTNWGISLDTIRDNGTNRFVVVSPLVGSRFYRLTKP